MVCKHIRELYSYVKEHDLKISAIDIINVECQKCQQKEKCDTIPIHSHK